MRTIFVAASALLFGAAHAFTASSLSSSRISKTISFGYVPSGFTPEQYKKFKEAEAKKNAKKNLGGLGPRGFKSRSFQSFQEALERGEAEHLLPVWNAEEKVKRGELKREDIPVSVCFYFRVPHSVGKVEGSGIVLLTKTFLCRIVHATRRSMG